MIVSALCVLGVHETKNSSLQDTMDEDTNQRSLLKDSGVYPSYSFVLKSKVRIAILEVVWLNYLYFLYSFLNCFIFCFLNVKTAS
jgi:hypothetical protein